MSELTREELELIENYERIVRGNIESSAQRRRHLRKMLMEYKSILQSHADTRQEYKSGSTFDEKQLAEIVEEWRKDCMQGNWGEWQEGGVDDMAYRQLMSMLQSETIMRKPRVSRDWLLKRRNKHMENPTFEDLVLMFEEAGMVVDEERK